MYLGQRKAFKRHSRQNSRTFRLNHPVIKRFFLSKEKLFPIAFSVLILLGVVFRARHYFSGRSLWLDEAMLALDILNLSFGELTQQPLPYQQGAPIGFLFFVKAITHITGDSEYAFRLYSFGASLIALFLLAYLAKRHLNKGGALFALALFTSNTHLIYYSAETKQYMGDVAVTLWLLFLLHHQLEGVFSQRKFALFSFSSIILIWFSHPAVFVVAALGIVLAVHYAQEKNRVALSFALLNLALSGISALLLYFLHLRSLSASKFLNAFWDEAFLPYPPTLRWFLLRWDGILEHPLGLEALPFFVGILFLAGVLYYWCNARLFASALSLTLFFTFLAGTLQKYPLAERMLLFALPVFILFLGTGLDAVYIFFSEKLAILRTLTHSSETQKRISFFITLFLALYILYAPFSESFSKLKNPLYREHIRPSMAYLKEHLREDDLIYIYYYAKPAFLFYLPKYHLEDSTYFVGGKYQEDPVGYLRETENLEGRVWFLFTHVYEDASINEEGFFINNLGQNAKRVREYRVPGTSVSLYLYEFR